MKHDGHDTSAAVAGAWVRKFPENTFPESLRKGTLVVVTFDESGGNEDNRIYTLFLGDMVKEASQQDPTALAERYTHYSVLRTIEDNFGLKPLTENDRTAGRSQIFGSDSRFVLQLRCMSHTLTIRLTDELLAWLNDTSRQTGMPEGRIVRQQ